MNPPTVIPGCLAFSYVRFSRSMQGKGRSYQRQKEAFEAWCTKHGAIPSDEAFFDKGKSGYTGDHVGPKGQLRRFLDLVEAGKIVKGSYLVVESIDRLGRENVNLAAERFLSITNAGVNVVTLMDNEKIYRPFGPAADLIMSVLVMERANEESATKAKRSKDNWQAAFAKARSEKKPVGKQVALWLELVEKDGKKEYRPIPERQEIVERIFTESIAGHGLIAIAQGLNREGKEAFRGKQGWCSSSVKDILDNRCVLGEWTPKDGKGTIEGYFPQIVKPETWVLAHQSMATRRKGDYTRQTANFQIWQQVARCYLCGSSMNLVTKGAHKYLACSNKRKGLCMDAVNVRADKSEEVYKEILVKVGALGLIQNEAAAVTDQMALVDASIHTQESILARHMAAADREDVGDSIYTLIGKAEREIKRLKAEREALEARHAEQTIAQGDKAWLLANLPLTERDDRQRANALLCRLGVSVHIKGGDTPLYMCFQKEKPFLQVMTRADEIVIVPLNEEQRQKFKEQDVDGADLAKGMKWLRTKIGPK